MRLCKFPGVITLFLIKTWKIWQKTKLVFACRAHFWAILTVKALFFDVCEQIACVFLPAGHKCGKGVYLTAA
jgi:hypothetical protein